MRERGVGREEESARTARRPPWRGAAASATGPAPAAATEADGACVRRAQQAGLRLPRISPRWWHVRAMSASHTSHYGYSPTSSVLRRAGVGFHQAADSPQSASPPYRTGLCDKDGFSAI